MISFPWMLLAQTSEVITYSNKIMAFNRPFGRTSLLFGKENTTPSLQRDCRTLDFKLHRTSCVCRIKSATRNLSLPVYH